MKRQRTLSDTPEDKLPKDRVPPSLMPELEALFDKTFSYTVPKEEHWSFKVEDLFKHKGTCH